VAEPRRRSVGGLRQRHCRLAQFDPLGNRPRRRVVGHLGPVPAAYIAGPPEPFPSGEGPQSPTTTSTVRSGTTGLRRLRPSPARVLTIRQPPEGRKFPQEPAGNRDSERCTWFDKHSGRAAVCFRRPICSLGYPEARAEIQRPEPSTWFYKRTRRGANCFKGLIATSRAITRTQRRSNRHPIITDRLSMGGD
jgi:hypothetical protein